MNKFKSLTAAIVFATGVMAGGQASAAEYYTQVTTTAPTPIDLINDKNEATLGNGQSRIVHAVIITNTDSSPVKVTLTKSVAVASGDTLVTKAVAIVPASSTHEISFPSGLYLYKTNAKVYDDIQVELSTTSSTPSADFTFDFKDN
ncbi:MAG: hypothetical protein ABSB19_08350 [Methylomonas sp.]|jgi:hypothetical protein